MQQEVYKEFEDLEDKHWWFVSRRKYIKTVVENTLAYKTDLDICEIGSGTGGNIEMLSRFGRLDSIEMNGSARSTIKQNKMAYLNDLSEGYLPDGINTTKNYDGIFALDVIEHVKDDVAAVRKIRSLLLNNGYVFATVPAYQWLWSEHDEVNQHYRRYTKRQFVNLFEPAGFEIVYSSYFNTLLFPLAVIDRLFAKMKKRSTEKRSGSIGMPSRFVNSLFREIFGLEAAWANKISMPFGLSILIVAKAI